jgi:hypothetical protein
VQSQDGVVTVDSSVVPLPPGDGLTIAIQALEAISTEAQQAVRKLDSLAGFSPMAPTAGATTVGSAAVSSAAPTVVAPVAAATIPNGPTAKSGQMNAGDVLHPGDSISSANGNYLLAMQTDGNLVLYSGTCPLWSSNTWGQPIAVCIMQTDGNLVLYNRSGQVVWKAFFDQFIAFPGSRLVVQNDGNVVIYAMDGKVTVWSTNTTHTIGSNTLIYRARLKRWTTLFMFGTKGNDTLLVKLPTGATLKSVCIAPVDFNDLNPDLNSPIGTQVGNSWAGVRLENVLSGPGFAAIATHWWFDPTSDVDYSISVWATGPTAYPVQDDGATITSACMDSQIVSQTEQWLENNNAVLIPAAAAIAALCIAIASGAAAAAIATAAVNAVVAGAKVVMNQSGK